MSSACRGSIGAIPPVWRCPRRGPSSTVHLSQRNSPPLGGGEVTVRDGEVTVRGGVAPKVQTTSAKNADNGVSWAKWSALWAQRCPAWCVARTRTAEYAR